jgi:hypothetical protein
MHRDPQVGACPRSFLYIEISGIEGKTRV